MMNAGSPMMASPNASDSNTEVSWPVAVTALSLLASAIVLLHLDTTCTMVAIWRVSDTFEHGFLVVPIFVWLCWLKRDELAHMQPRMSWVPVPFILITGMVWLLAYALDILVVQHVTLVATVSLGLWSLLGTPIARVLAFPLCFLLFAAPVGDELVPVMMDVTADFVVAVISATGIPIFREGLYFSLPSGDWSVVEACSGIRYLIASLVLSSVFVHLNLSRWWSCITFMVLAIIVPVVANGLRAWLIVMIAHHSSNTLAVGVDHFIYGWLFFGLVMSVLFSFGYLLARLEGEGSHSSHPIQLIPTKQPCTVEVLGKRQFISRALIVLCVVAIWPLLASSMSDVSEINYDPERVETVSTTRLSLPAESGWEGGTPDSLFWRPAFSGHEQSHELIAEGDDGASYLANVLTFSEQSQGDEMVAWRNVVVPRRGTDWEIVGTVKGVIGTDSVSFSVNKTHLRTGDTELTVWWWYRVAGINTSNRYLAKMLEAKNRLFTGKLASHAVFLATDVDVEKADDALKRFSGDIYPYLQQQLFR